MDEEIKKLIEENLALTQENNAILKKIQRHTRWTTIANTIYWVMIIGIALGAFYFLQPYFDRVVSTFMSVKSELDSFSQTTSQFQNPFK